MEHKPLRSADVRDRNQKLILRLLFQKGAMSQSHVVQRTGLKAPTVFRIFSKLEEERFIRPCKNPDEDSGRESDKKGRRPSYFCIVPKAAFAVGVDFSMAGASVIIVNFVNEVIYSEGTEFSPNIGRDEVLSRIGALINSGMDQSGIDRMRIVGVGIGAPGTVDTATGVVVDYSRIPGLAGTSLKDHFAGLFGAPVFVHNNASVIAASEYNYATAKEFDSVLAVLVRGGVGAAFVNHGQIFLNGTTTALEMGRMNAGIGGDRTVEELVSERPLLDILAAQGITDWEQAESRLSAAQLAQALAGPSAVLATAVRNLYHILHPDAILVISRFGQLARALTDTVARAVPEADTIPITYDPTKACYGATDLVFQHYFSDGAGFLVRGLPG